MIDPCTFVGKVRALRHTAFHEKSFDLKNNPARLFRCPTASDPSRIAAAGKNTTFPALKKQVKALRAALNPCPSRRTSSLFIESVQSTLSTSNRHEKCTTCFCPFSCTLFTFGHLLSTSVRDRFALTSYPPHRKTENYCSHRCHGCHTTGVPLPCTAQYPRLTAAICSSFCLASGRHEAKLFFMGCLITVLRCRLICLLITCAIHSAAALSSPTVTTVSGRTAILNTHAVPPAGQVHHEGPLVFPRTRPFCCLFFSAPTRKIIILCVCPLSSSHVLLLTRIVFSFRLHANYCRAKFTHSGKQATTHSSLIRPCRATRRVVAQPKLVWFGVLLFFFSDTLCMIPPITRELASPLHSIRTCPLPHLPSGKHSHGCKNQLQLDGASMLR